MDKDTRNAIERATQRARKLLEEDFGAQLASVYDVLPTGDVPERGGAHLGPRQHFLRATIVAALAHKRASGMSAAEAVADYRRDAAFTTLHRFVALKMLEARALVQECVSKGEQSVGYKEHCGLAPGLALLPDGAGYRLYIESLFDELSTEIKVLFDRRDPAAVLWPKRAAFDALLELLGAPELASVWIEDETIGWVYQYFNSGDERRAMRDASQAPRNSRELAVRNQFFTPRYVVQFLTDNTLGRIWYEMRGGKSQLAERCEYMVRRPDETYAPRTEKDPRELRVLDPACGSGHFLLYAFDLLLVIYEEAWASGQALRADYPELAALQRAIPALILEHNLHGVDIDPRAAQIAALALWMRAQRAWKDLGVPAAERPRVRRTHIVIAEPMPGDAALVDEFAVKLEPPLLRELFRKMVSEMRLAGDLGSLIPVEAGIAAELTRAREQLAKQNESAGYLPGMAPEKKQGELDLSGIDDDGFFHEAELRIVEALRRFADAASAAASVRRRLFADDAGQGVALIDLLRTRFDVVLMNPPFGEPSERSRQAHKRLCPDSADNLAVSFLSRGLELLAAHGVLGAITDRSWHTKFDYSDFRRRMIGADVLHQIIDLGWGVLDANVETSLGVFRGGSGFVGWRCPSEDRAASLRTWARSAPVCAFTCSDFGNMPNAILAYDMPRPEYASYASQAYVPKTVLKAVAGIKSCDSAADFRLWWEVCPAYERLREAGARWRPLHNGSPYSPFHFPTPFAVRAAHSFRELLARGGALPGAAYYGVGGAAYGKRTDRMYSYRRNPGEIFSQEGQALFPAEGASDWDVLALSNSFLFARHANYVAGQHKYHNYVNLIALSRTRDRRAATAAERAFTMLAALDASNELAGGFQHPGACQEFNLENTADRRAELARTRLEAVRALHDEVNTALASIEADRTPAKGVDYYDVYFGSAFSESLVYAVWVSWAVGCAFGRWASGTLRAALADDPGAADDLVSAIALPRDRFPAEELRAFLQGEFFQHHLSRYSRSRRKGPVYWQLATPSARYSVWLYLHAFSRDTLFAVQRLVKDKLDHEQRRLDALHQDLAERPKAAHRDALASQEIFVDELRAFLDEVKRVAPLWNPDLDDGVIINFAPLYRLVPHHTGWQKQLKATWDELCAEQYDWAHLAMHLWPERVVLKCARDRSLAIAHELEAVFWVEGEDGKWKPRATPTRPVAELIAERTSPAVKAALASLVSAPATGTRKAKAGRRKARNGARA